MKTKPITPAQRRENPLLCQFADAAPNRQRGPVSACSKAADRSVAELNATALDVLRRIEEGLASAFPNSVAVAVPDADDLAESMDPLSAWSYAAGPDHRALICDHLLALVDGIDPALDDARGELDRHRHGAQCGDGSAHPVPPNLPELGVRLADVVKDLLIREVDAQPDADTTKTD